MAEENLLECGSSLAEREHCASGVPPTPQSLKAPAMVDGAFQSVSDLRTALASDAITSKGATIQTFVSPFETSIKHGQKSNVTVPLVYCDQTASNRPVRSIERYMEETCLPLYGNTHTNTSITGSQSTAFVSEARQIVAESTNAKITGKASLDVVLFAGNGTTSAVELLIDCLGLKHAAMDNDNRPVVFIGPYEHHSNLLPWRESGCEIVMVPECPETYSVDLAALERLLLMPSYANRLKMGTFSAASNVNGKISDVDSIAATLHKHGALAFFDYATGAPYMPMNMNPPPSETYSSTSLIAKDAIFLSPHKMLGGVGTPGVLIVKKHLVNQTNAPSRSGGGTVFYVTNTHHRFLSNRVERNEGGTPNINGIMRTGLTFLLKRKAEEKYALLRDRAKDNEELPSTLLDYDCATYEYVVKTLRERAPNLIMLGHGSGGAHLPIFSFLIRCGRRFLHYNFVCALLNDLFGIQSRGGCQCSGPYSQRLLGLTDSTSDGMESPNKRNQEIEHALVNYKERAEVLRPGYTRLSLPFKGVRDEEVEYVINALEWISRNGWAMMCQYRCNHRTGEVRATVLCNTYVGGSFAWALVSLCCSDFQWRHASRQGKPLGRTERKWLSHYEIVSDIRGSQIQNGETSSTLVHDLLRTTLSNADVLLEEARLDQPSLAQALKMVSTDVSGGTESDFIESLRWFVYPKECAHWIAEGRTVVPYTESEDVFGALRPVRIVFTNMEVCEGQARKRKHFHPFREPVDVPTNSSGQMDAEKIPESSVVFAFRDGEHQGEATFDEIATGHEDGELSDRCEICDPNADCWVPIHKYAAFTETDVTNCTSSSTVKDETQRIGHPESNDRRPKSVQVDPPSKAESVGTSLVPANDLVADTTNQRKKPQRGSSAWGSTAPIPINVKLKSSVENAVTSGPNATSTKKNKRGLHVKPPAKIMRYITQAIFQWNMLEDGDRLLLGLSGGKDSLSLLHCLMELQRKLPTNFEIEVCTIDPMTPSFDPSPLIPYVESLGLKYHYIKDDIVTRASTSGKDKQVVSSLCAYCARMKRGNLYTCARRNNCNKLVLAQHLDDCAESFLMSVMHNGFLRYVLGKHHYTLEMLYSHISFCYIFRTMKANYMINAGDLSVIRPMVYCRESLMTDFAKAANLPVINENCPACFEEPKERARIKKLLAREETLFPNLHDNIRRSLIPLMHDESTAILRCYLEETLARGKKDNSPKDAGKGRKGKRVAVNVMSEEKKGDQGDVQTEDTKPAPLPEAGHDQKRVKTSLAEASEEDLMMELARRKAEKYRLAGAMSRRVEDGGPVDPTGQVCTLDGRDGTIPCRELME